MKVSSLALGSSILFFSACTVSRLSKQDLAWQPYLVNDKIIFESSKGEIDSVKIESIEKYNNPDDPLALFPNRVQTLFVVTKHGSIAEFNATKYGSEIEFQLRLGKNNLKYPSISLSLENGGIEKEEMVDFDSKRCYKITARQSYSNLQDMPFDLKYIYWSKQYGYLGLEFKDGYTWKLKSLIREGRNVF